MNLLKWMNAMNVTVTCDAVYCALYYIVKLRIISSDFFSLIL